MTICQLQLFLAEPAETTPAEDRRFTDDEIHMSLNRAFNSGASIDMVRERLEETLAGGYCTRGDYEAAKLAIELRKEG